MKHRTLVSRLIIFAVSLLIIASNNTDALASTPTENTIPSSTQFLIPVPEMPPSFPQAQLARTPPMGWNSFNHFGCAIDEYMVRETIDALVGSGMKAAGYQYVVIDDCWMWHKRDVNGNLQVNLNKFPRGLKDLADYAHSRGLKLGLYLDRGIQTCAGYPGSFGHEVQDASLVASWGIDYIKYDNCFAVGSLLTDYWNMHNALLATGRPIVFSICSWRFPGIEIPKLDIGHLWRTSADIKDNWDSIINNMEENNNFAAYAGPGHWNDPDMLEVGNGGMTVDEYKAHFSMWAMMAAPLMAGNDLRYMSQATMDILTASEVIAVDQDPLGIQGTRVESLSQPNGTQIWSKTLSGSNTHAVMLLNLSEQAENIVVYWNKVGLPTGPALVRDLWSQTDLGQYNNSYSTEVPAHGAVMIRVTSLLHVEGYLFPGK
jgi:alpha-galactosidase